MRGAGIRSDLTDHEVSRATDVEHKDSADVGRGDDASRGDAGSPNTSVQPSTRAHDAMMIHDRLSGEQRFQSLGGSQPSARAPHLIPEKPSHREA